MCVVCVYERCGRDIFIRVTTAVMKQHEQKQVGEERVFSVSTFIVHIQRKSEEELKQGRNLRAAAGTEAIERCC